MTICLHAFIDASQRANGQHLSREDVLDEAMPVFSFVKLLSAPSA